MQATITYLLTEQAQRAMMAATGQPVKRKQTATIEVQAEDLDYYPVANDGTIAVDLTNTSWIGGRKVNTGPFAEMPSVPDLVHAAIAEEEAYKARKQAELDQNLAEQLAAVERFLADPALRATIYSSSAYTYVADVRIDRDAREYHAACPRWDEFEAEASRRNALDAEARKEAARIKAEKEAAEAAKESAKLEFLAAWIAEHGSDSQKARSADCLLCRDEATTTMADVTFRCLDGHYHYTRDLRPTVSCTNDACDGEECEVKYSVTESVNCLREREYGRYKAIQADLPDAVYVLQTRTAIHDCSHTPDCETGEEVHTCLVKVQVGPFSLQREYVL